MVPHATFAALKGVLTAAGERTLPKMMRGVSGKKPLYPACWLRLVFLTRP